MARSIDTTLPGLEWLAIERETERAAIAARGGASVAERRMRQDAQRRAARERATGTNLTDRESDWLYHRAVIIETPTA